MSMVQLKELVMHAYRRLSSKLDFLIKVNTTVRLKTEILLFSTPILFL